MPSFKTYSSKLICGTVALAALWMLSGAASAQDRDRDYRERLGVTRLQPGMLIPVRTDQTIDVERKDNRVYWGTVAQDVFGDNGRLAIPRGARAEMMVRVAQDNDLILDLESINVNGERYAVAARPNRFESDNAGGIVGAIAGALGAQIRGPAVRVPRETVITFRLQQPLDLGVQDRGYDRDGYHYHDYDRDRR